MQLPPEGSTVILGAWHPAYEQIVDALMVRRCRVGVLFTSSVGEMGFEPSEVAHYAKLATDARIAFIWTSCQALAEVSSTKVFYAPYPIVVKHLGQLGVAKEPWAGLFCPTTAKKNILNQLVAAQFLQRSPGLQLHTNVELTLALTGLVPGLSCIAHSWLPRPQYEAIVQRCRVVLACSWAETLSYGAAEAVMLGTPVVGSMTVPFLRDWRPWTVQNANDPTEIAAVARELAQDSERVATRQYQALEDYADRANEDLKSRLMDYGVLT